ncbi:MAG: 6-carboxytetrahydropterin synthase QueD [Gorillibacterium sp.]|nr:6-carboxytetrahydropterin synthase QueD [Gorillibacterium sp.]
MTKDNCRTPGPFVIPEHIQRLGDDISLDQLRYHRRRVLVCKEFTFDAAHHLHAYEGKCKNMHGHTYKVVFGLSAFTDEIGLAIDFGEIKNIWRTHIEGWLDHRYLNDALPKMNTTAENMVVWLYEKMEEALQSEPYHLKFEGGRTEFVRLFETATSYAEARREWMQNE